jgi:hypothetical protein
MSHIHGYSNSSAFFDNPERSRYFRSNGYCLYDIFMACDQRFQRGHGRLDERTFIQRSASERIQKRAFQMDAHDNRWRPVFSRPPFDRWSPAADRSPLYFHRFPHRIHIVPHHAYRAGIDCRKYCAGS